MNLPNTDNLDEIILEEKKLVVREHFLDAWEAGLQDGIEAEIIAKELVKSALIQLSRSAGADQTSKLVSELGEQDAVGAFLPNKTVQ